MGKTYFLFLFLAAVAVAQVSATHHRRVCTGLNEVWSKSKLSNCQPSCQNPNPTNCKKKRCRGCVCKSGYYRNSSGSCVLPGDCDNCKGDTTKVFNPCGNVCPVTCDNVNNTFIRCPKICYPGGGCVCRKGLVEDSEGKCIPPSECPVKCGLNEYYACGSACDTDCSSLGKPCPIKSIRCVKKCYCNKGYARNQAGDCIPIKNCPGKSICRQNERYNPCPLNCPPEETCEDCLSVLSKNCVPATECIPKCECKRGYVRKGGANGCCVLDSEC